MSELDYDLRELVTSRFPPGATLHPLPVNTQRQDHTRQCAFVVARGKDKIAHLTVGTELSSLWARHEAFHNACPSITARPLFMDKSRDLHFLGREFIDGRSAADLLHSGEMTTAQADEHITKIQETLTRTQIASDLSSAQVETAQVFGQIQQIPYLSTVDKVIFDSLLAPLVYTGLESITPSTRWTNGDFTAHNVIISTDEHARLIDYEFAHKTHFPSEDQWRWLTFSGLPNNGSITAAHFTHEAIPPWLEIFFWTRQLVLRHVTALPEIAHCDSRHAIAQITRLSSAAGLPLGSGIFAQTLQAQSAAESGADRLKLERDELRDKVRRMQNSRSWKISAPLRAIRRWLSR